MTAILRNVPKTFTFEEQRIEINEIALDLYNLKLGTLELTDFSVVKPNPAASGSGDVTYDNTTGEFTYTPPDLSGFLTSQTVYSVEALLSPGIQLLDDGNAQASNRIFFDGLNGLSITRKSGTTNTIEFAADTDWNNAVSWGDHKLEGYLKSNGTYWDTNTNAYESSTLDLIGNVTLTNIQNDQYLKWNGTAWVNTSISIPAAQVQVDWNQTDINHIEYIKNKPTLVENINDLGDVDTTGITNGKILKSDSTGNWIIADETDTTYNEFTGTTAGLVPASTLPVVTKFLRSDGVWADTPNSDTNTTYQLDSSTANTNDVKITLLDNNSNSDSVTITKGNNITFDQVTTSGFRISATGGSGGGATDFTDLGDTPNSLTANKWIRVNSGGASLEFINGNLEDLNNFALTVGQGNVAETDQVVQWNGTTWTNATLDLPSELSDLTDVSNAAPSDGQVLKWDNSNQLWKPASDLTSSGTGISLTDISLSKLPASATPDLDWDDQTGTFEYTPFDTKFTKLSDTPSTLTAGKHLKVNTGGTALEYVDNTFTNLTDTPSSLTANKWLKVNATGTALEYTDAPSGGGGGANVTISDTEPSSPSTGDLWWASDEGQLKIYYDDGVGTPSAQWVDTGGVGGGTAGTDNYVTNASLTGTDLVLTRSGGLSNITTDLSSLSGSGGATYTIEALSSPGIQLLDDGNAQASNRVFFDAGTGITLTRTSTSPHTIEFSAATFAGTTVGMVPASTAGETTKFLRSDGTWQTVSGSGGGSPGGSNTQMQYNNNGAFGGTSKVTWDNTNSDIVFEGTSVSNALRWDSSQSALRLESSSVEMQFVGDAQHIHTIEQSGDYLMVGAKGTGAKLYLDATSTIKFITAGDAANVLLEATDDGPVNLYYAYGKKFETTQDGVKVTGGIEDKDGNLGTAGQILSSTGTELDWIDAPSGGNGIVSANVKDFGALGDDNNNDTTAIQNAINSLLGAATGKGGIVYFPPGVYRINSALTFDNTAYSITLKGSSTHMPVGVTGGSIIRNTNTSGNTIEITNSSSISITNLGIDHTSNTSGVAIKATSATSPGDRQGVEVDQVYILKHSKGIELFGYANSIIRNTEIRDQPDNANSTYAILLKKGSDNRQDQIRLENVIVEGETPAGSGAPHSYSVGLQVEDWTNSIWVKDCAFLRMTNGIYFHQNMGGEVATAGAFHRIENSDVDHCRNNGMFFDGGYAIWVQNCYIGSNGYPLGSNQQSGLVTGENFKGTMWINNADCRGNSKYGLAFNVNHNKIHINSCHCGDNGAASPASSAGIYALNGANDITIIGGQCGGNNYGDAEINSGNQQNGIKFDGDTHRRININGVDTTGNISSGIVWQLGGQNTMSSSNNFIQNCPGYSTGQTTFP